MSFSEKNSMLRQSSITACGIWPTPTHDIFFQDNHGRIRIISSNEYKKYEGGDEDSRIFIANNAKWHTPLAAVAYGTACPNHKDVHIKDKRIHLFYLNSENLIRCIKFDGEQWMAAIEFNKLNVAVHPSSHLSAVALDQGSKILLYYQGLDNNIYERIFTLRSASWSGDRRVTLAIPGSHISAVAQIVNGVTKIFVFNQQKALDIICTSRDIETSTFSETGASATLLPHQSFNATFAPGKKLNHMVTSIEKEHCIVWSEGPYFKGRVPTPEADALVYSGCAALAISSGALPSGEEDVKFHVFYQGSKLQLRSAVYQYPAGKWIDGVRDLPTGQDK